MPLRTGVCVMSVSGPLHGLLRCRLCDYQTKTPTGIKLHMKFVHKKKAVLPKSRECNNCKKIFSTEKEVEDHYNTEHRIHLKNNKK